MCGIAGIVDFRDRVEEDMVGPMLSVLRHRGPDGDGSWAEDGIALGHKRLAIIDISEAGAQPMHYGEGRYVVTFNGEIYNYIELRDELRKAGFQFHTESDTEVLLAAYAHWGDDCLYRFNGMFAFALYDRREKRLFCARDRLGVKPFMYTWDGHRFAFASEAKALLAAGVVSGEPNNDAIYEYLSRGYTTSGRSFYAGVTHLEPGCSIVVESGSIKVREWWTPDRSPMEDLSRAEIVEKISWTLDDAVRLRLRSDVPVGAHLSGGLDSSAVVAAAARHGGAEVHTFTGAFELEPSSDEREFSRAVNAMYDLRGHEVEIDVDDLAKVFDRLLWHMDEPIAGPGVFPQLAVCDLAREAGFIVVLGGQGGDELFGGYLRHRALHYKRSLRQGGFMHRMGAAFELSRLAASEWRRVRRTATRTGDEHLSPEFLAQVSPELREDARRSVLSVANASDLMWWDLKNYLPALLHVEDRTSMAASLESRTPLLDYRLVEFALRIPEDERFTLGAPKPLLREAVQSWVPKSVADRRDKKGFPTPLHQWQDRPALRDLVLRLTSSNSLVFSKKYLLSHDSFSASELWTVLMIQGWMSSLYSGALGVPRKVAA